MISQKEMPEDEAERGISDILKKPKRPEAGYQKEIFS